MKFLALVANILLPGVGSFIVGKVGIGIAQVGIWGFGLMFTVGTFGVGGIIGIPLMLIAWIWAIVTAVTDPKPVEVRVVNEPGGH